MLVNLLAIAAIALGISSMVWPPRLPVLLPVAVIILGLMKYVPVS